jgi:hypothetical protein
MIQHGMAPSVPMHDPSELIMPPYHPFMSSSASSALMTRAYDGCRSSRRGGWTLTMGSSAMRLLAPLTGAFPLSLMVAIVLVSTVIESLRMPRVEDVVATGDDDMGQVCVVVGIVACVQATNVWENMFVVRQRECTLYVHMRGSYDLGPTACMSCGP